MTFNDSALLHISSDTGYDETLNAVTMPMINNDMCSQIKGDAGPSRICAGGKSGEGVCDVRVDETCYETERMHFERSSVQYNPFFVAVIPSLMVCSQPLLLQKDNGGPLVCQEHGHKVVIGVSIQRTKCASSQPALFVNVAFYSEWIYKVFRLYPNMERN